MSKDEWIYITHMLNMSRKDVDLIEGLGRSDYDQDETLRLALTHLVQIIGEAAQRVSPEFREQYPNIPWKEIVGMRNRIVHDYLNVDEDVIWEVVQQDIPPLVEALAKIVPPEQE